MDVYRTVQVSAFAPTQNNNWNILLWIFEWPFRGFIVGTYLLYFTLQSYIKDPASSVVDLK